MKIFYHKDLDGECSAAIVNYHYSLYKPEVKPEFYAITYGEDFPWADIKEDERVYMVDFSLQPFSDMYRLNALADLVWVDHHVTAINDYQAHLRIGGKEIAGRISKTNDPFNFAGCELTWRMFNWDTPYVPEAVALLGKYDVWDHEDKRVVPFQYGMRQHANTHPSNNKLWFKFFEGSNILLIDLITDTGKIVLSYQAKEDAKACAKCAFEVTWGGLTYIVCNNPRNSSNVFDSVWDPKRHDAMMVFCLSSKGPWNVSLYSEGDVDVGKVAKAQGGGGHKNAAGFSCTKLPFYHKEM